MLKKFCLVIAWCCFGWAGYLLISPAPTNRFFCRSNVDWPSDSISEPMEYRDAVREYSVSLATRRNNFGKPRPYSIYYQDSQEPLVVMKAFTARYQVYDRPYYDATILTQSPIYRDTWLLSKLAQYGQSCWWAVLGFTALLAGRGAWMAELRCYLVFRILGSALVWPIMLLWWHKRKLVYTAHQTVRWANYALSLVLSAGASGLAKAQSQNTASGQSPTVEIPLTDGEVKIHAPKYRLVVNLFGDGVERQSWLIFSGTHWTVFQQNRQSDDGGSPFSFIGAGPRIAGKTWQIQTWVGPQYTLQTDRVDRLLVYTVLSGNRGGFTWLSANKLNFRLAGAAPFAHRHVQNIHFKPLPRGLSLQGEQLRVPAKPKQWQELEIGLYWEPGKTVRAKNWLCRSLYFFPYRDLAKNKWYARVGLNFAFAF